MIIPPRRIIFSGGGIRVLSHLGSLVALHEKNLLYSVKEWIGVSAGAFLATLCGSGYTIPQLQTLHTIVDFSSVRSDEPGNPLEILESFGMDSGENLELFIIKYLNKKGFSKTSTFQDLHTKTGFSIRMWATDIQTSTPIEFSTNKTPSYPVVSALRASMSLPIVFTPIRHLHTNNLLIDGGCMGNYPIKYLSPLEKQSCLGISFINTNPKLNVDIDSILTYFQKLASLHYNAEDKNTIVEYSTKTIFSPCGDYPSWNFEASLEDRIHLFNVGYKAANDFLSHTPTNSTNVYKGMRRRSVS